MHTNKHIRILCCLALLTLGACTKRFDAMNVNPNAPTVAPETNILGNSIYAIANTLEGERLGMFYAGTYSGQTCYFQIGAFYEYRDAIVTGHWSTIYHTLNDLQKVINTAAADGDKNMQAAALTLKVYIAQKATDFWKDMPYSQALKGDSGVVAPAYDTQQQIYGQLAAELKTAAGLFNEKSIDQLGSGDILFNGSLDKWKKFCNSLRLRVAIRMSNVDAAGAKATLTEILGNPSTYPVMGSNDDDANLIWPGVAPYVEPWYSFLVLSRRNDYGLCANLVDTLKKFNDPRLPAYGVPALSDGAYRGYKMGSPNSDFTANDVSAPGKRFAGVAAGFSPLLRYPEVAFIRAEAYSRGLVTGDARAAYEAAVTASLAENGITVSAGYLAGPGVAWSGDASDLKKIYLQKWIALFKESSEAWAEARRTDVPLMEAIPYDYKGSHNRPAFRYPYPQNEYQLNSANLNPHLTGIDAASQLFWGQQMWWDTRTGVH
ncbi:MAG: SusD/RagB family nutrient-binding outer membrane lipoprotein [Bacteroidetes bacterium]|nr:SusD/RagB family nutrient-binding outer membrane lipoprotein [Bacteroidota bacterium]